MHFLSLRQRGKTSPEKTDRDYELRSQGRAILGFDALDIPELTKIVTDNIQYAKVVKMMGNRANAVNLDFSEVIIDI